VTKQELLDLSAMEKRGHNRRNWGALKVGVFIALLVIIDRKRDTEGHINSSSETQKDKMSRKPTMPIYDGICGNNALFHKKKAPGKSGAVNLFFIPKHRP
jgi:hypothetical protein